ncbi:MAG: polysaccharide biosynthesis/export family protein [Candidatus Aminicenantaceae bacterium]
MKRVIKGITGTIIILVCISCISHRGIHLVNLTAKELFSETEVVLTTTKPVQYSFTKLEEPPTLIIKFPKDKIYSSSDDIVNVNKGPIKKIINEFSSQGDNDQHQLHLVRIELTQDLPYEIFDSGSSIIVRVKNPQKNLTSTIPEKQMADIQSQISGEDLLSESGYLVGPGDVLNIEVWKQPDVTREVVVDYKGEIRLPPIRKISVLGLTVPQAEEKLMEELSKYLIDPIVFVTVKEYNSQRVIALGETKTGMYTLNRRTTLVEFLGQIGGPTENADMYHIKLIKKDGRVITYNFNELIKDPQKGNQALVSGGDTVYVPPLEMKKVYVLGEVKDPKFVYVKGTLTLIDAIAEAGGYTRDAVTKSIIVIRGELGSQKGIRVNLSRILKKGDLGQNIELMPGDIVYVPKSFIVDIERVLRDIALPLTWYFWFAK